MGVFVAPLLLFAHSFFIRSRFNFVIYSSPPTPLVSILFGLTQPPQLLVSKATLFYCARLSSRCHIQNPMLCVQTEVCWAKRRERSSSYRYARRHLFMTSADYYLFSSYELIVHSITKSAAVGFSSSWLHTAHAAPITCSIKTYDYLFLYNATVYFTAIIDHACSTFCICRSSCEIS